MRMEESASKTKLKINMCTHRRLSIQHEIEENLCKQNYLSNIHSYNYQEQLINRKINHLKKTLEHIEPYSSDHMNEKESTMAPNCFNRIQNHFRLLNFSSETEKRLLRRTSSNHLPNISQKRNSNEINQSLRRVSLYQPNQPKKDSYQSAINHRFSNGNLFEQKPFQSYLNQQIFDEQKKQLKNDERQTFLLKEFDELKHTIDDPHSTFSVLAALSRAILFLDSATE